jgi:6-phosphogluconolactonase
MNLKRLIFVIASVLGGMTVNSFAAESLVYFGTYTSTNTKGIYVSRFDSDTGKLSAPELVAETKKPDVSRRASQRTLSLRRQ